MNLKSHLAAASLLVLAATAHAGVVTTFADPALTGGTVDNFSSYAIGTPTSVGTGYTMTQNGGGTLAVTDGFSGMYGAVGRSVVSWGNSGVTITFGQSISAFALLIGGADFDWSVEAFDGLGSSLGSSTIAHNVNGFVAGWAAADIKSAKLSPVNLDAVLFDNLTIAATNTVPEPTALSLAAIALLGVAASRKRRANKA